MKKRLLPVNSDPSRSQNKSNSQPEHYKPAVASLAQPPASRLRRAFFLILLALLCWLTYSMYTNLFQGKSKKVIYASRYSNEYKFRPAASPIITEALKDGRVRLRGALPEATVLPTPPVVSKKKKSAGKANGKRKFTSKAKGHPHRT